MNMQKLTQKSIEAIQNSRALALEHGNPEIMQEHLLLSLLSSEGGLIPELIKAQGADPDSLSSTIRTLIEKLPKVSGGSSPYASRDIELSLIAAEKQAEAMKDEYVSVEPIMLGIIRKPSASLKPILKKFEISEDSFLGALASVRKNARVTSDDPESTYDALKKYGSDLTALAREKKLEPVIGRDAEIRNVIRILSRKTKNML